MTSAFFLPFYLQLTLNGLSNNPPPLPEKTTFKKPSLIRVTAISDCGLSSIISIFTF